MGTTGPYSNTKMSASQKNREREIGDILAGKERSFKNKETVHSR